MGTRAIEEKCGGVPQPFRTNEELKATVRKYINSKDNPKDAEEIARTYSWPIGKWDVSNLQDFSGVFQDCYTFNEDISEWDTSNATNMLCMFYDAAMFNQPIGRWNTSSVQSMLSMFCAVSYTHLTLPTKA